MELTKEEKISIVTQHIKTIALNIYNLQLTLIAENAISPVNQANINSINTQLSTENSKIQALELELDSLSE